MAPSLSPISPPTKSLPLPWGHHETLALIQAYQEKWYSLKKGQLKAFQWQEVAIAVAARCGFDEPSKTAIQCRHKIEKLRKRYRSELQKPYPNYWQYFDLMDQMERGPLPFNARPISVVKSSPNNANCKSNSNNSNNVNYGYGSVFSTSAEFHYNNNASSRGDGGGGSDDSDEEWNTSYGMEAMMRNKSKSINNIVRGKAGVNAMRNTINGKRKEYCGGNYSTDDLEDDVEQAEDGEGDVGAELAAKIRGFSETFMRMECKKMEMMHEIEKNRMEMEKKRMAMILEAQRKMINTISRAVRTHNNARMNHEI